MLLKQVILHNIRSYSEETIIFPEGSCLLSGDIGSGKSTILLAVEFALFGASRTELPAESLLRKGTTQANVELTFILEGKEITIKRGLKKEKYAIKQTAGYIINNGIKKELTPLELKAEILALLGYPEEFLAKTKNYIYQYTVYTPQEEMKSILQENAEIRLDTLRKIFNIDKYKIIRENLQSYLRFMREQMRMLETRLESFEEMKQQWQNMKYEEMAVQESWQLLEPKIAEVRTTLVQQQQKVDLCEQQQQQFQELQHQQNTLRALLQERQEQAQQLGEQQETVWQEHDSLIVPEGILFEEVLAEKKKLEEQRHSLLLQQTVLRERLTAVEKSLQQRQQEIIHTRTGVARIAEKEKELQQIHLETEQRPALHEKKKQLEDLFFKAAEMITKNETLLAHSLELQQKIKALDVCPTCLQHVSIEHKHTIEEAEISKIKQAEQLLFEFKKKRVQIVQEREQVQKQLEHVRAKEALLGKVQAELQQLTEKKDELQQKEEHLATIQQENTALRTEWERLQQDTTLKVIAIRLSQLQEIQEKLVKKKILEERMQEIAQQVSLAGEQIIVLRSKIAALQQQLQLHPDPTLILKEEKIILTELVHREKSFSVQQAQLQTQLQGLQKQNTALQETFEKLREYQRELGRRKELYHWLEEHFLNLTYTLEKHIMVSIVAIFNQLFQEWFSILIADEGITSRIDDSFYPLIEQNGYEIPFSMLSGGEKTSAALAYRLALNRVINDIIHQIKTKDLLILDEPTDGFSSEQLDKVREVLEKLQLRQTIIVSHESKIESFVENVIRIRKEREGSKVFLGG